MRAVNTRTAALAIRAKAGILTSTLACFISLTSSGSGAQDCPGPVGPSCASYSASFTKDACIRPGVTFIDYGVGWNSLPLKKKIFHSEPITLEFVHIVDGTQTKQTNGLLFVGIERVSKAGTSVALSRNVTDGFAGSEEKYKYSQAVTWQASATRVLRQWGKVPDVGNIWELDSGTMKDFDFPQAVKSDDRSPHARLYRFQAGSISCVPFATEAWDDITEVFGTVVDVYGANKEHARFHVILESE
jgi:hypothetical protein